MNKIMMVLFGLVFLSVFVSADTIVQFHYAPTLATNGTVKAYIWFVDGDYQETGIEWQRSPEYQTHKAIAVKRSDNTYSAAFAFDFHNSVGYLMRAYAIGYDYQKTTTNWKMVKLETGIAETPASEMQKKVWDRMKLNIQQVNSFSGTNYTINSMDYIKFGQDMGWEGVKALTIGNCLDNGFADVWCAVDIITTAGMCVSLTQPETTAPAMAINTILKQASILKTVKSFIELKAIVKSLSFLSKEGKFYEITTSKLAIFAKSGLIELETGKIVTKYPYLAKAVMFSSNTENFFAMQRLLAKGATKEMLEYIAEKRGNLIGILSVTLRNDKIKTVWFDTATRTQMVERKHYVDFVKALSLSGISNIEKLIMEIAKNGTQQAGDPYVIGKIMKNPATSECYLVKVVIENLANTRIITAYPNYLKGVRC